MSLTPVDFKTKHISIINGIYLRAYPQGQIWDFTGQDKFSISADKGSGGLWNNPAGSQGKDSPFQAHKQIERWNQLRVIMAGSRV